MSLVPTGSLIMSCPEGSATTLDVLSLAEIYKHLLDSAPDLPHIWLGVSRSGRCWPAVPFRPCAGNSASLELTVDRAAKQPFATLAALLLDRGDAASDPAGGRAVGCAARSHLGQDHFWGERRSGRDPSPDDAGAESQADRAQRGERAVGAPRDAGEPQEDFGGDEHRCQRASGAAERRRRAAERGGGGGGDGPAAAEAADLLRGRRGAAIADEGRDLPRDAEEGRPGLCRRGGGDGERAAAHRAGGARDADRASAGGGRDAGAGAGRVQECRSVRPRVRVRRDYGEGGPGYDAADGQC